MALNKWIKLNNVPPWNMQFYIIIIVGWFKKKIRICIYHKYLVILWNILIASYLSKYTLIMYVCLKPNIKWEFSFMNMNLEIDDIDIIGMTECVGRNLL